jgi:NADH-quinone oxidoreductase subunit H
MFNYPLKQIKSFVIKFTSFFTIWLFRFSNFIFIFSTLPFFRTFQFFLQFFLQFFFKNLIFFGPFVIFFWLHVFVFQFNIVESAALVLGLFIMYGIGFIFIIVLGFILKLFFDPVTQMQALDVIIFILESISIFLPFILAVAYITLMERKVLASIQLRRGPDVVGPFGLLQPLADGFKLLLKELVKPYISNTSVFIASPILTFFFAFFGLSILPFYHFEILFDVELSLILFFGLSTLGIYGIILSGWASNSRYAFLGSLRSTAQLISYEVSLGLVIQTVALPTSSIAFSDIVKYQQLHGWFIFPFFITFILFVISTFAETNRPPFDLPEAEAELVSGYNVEYSSTTFALFFIGEYANLITSTLVTVFFFFGGADENSIFGPFSLGIKIVFFLGLFLFIRAALPRFRYDQLMHFGWKGILPISFGWFCLTATFFYFFCRLNFSSCSFLRKNINDS